MMPHRPRTRLTPPAGARRRLSEGLGITEAFLPRKGATLRGSATSRQLSPRTAIGAEATARRRPWKYTINYLSRRRSVFRFSFRDSCNAFRTSASPVRITATAIMEIHVDWLTCCQSPNAAATAIAIAALARIQDFFEFEYQPPTTPPVMPNVRAKPTAEAGGVSPG